MESNTKQLRLPLVKNLRLVSTKPFTCHWNPGRGCAACQLIFFQLADVQTPCDIWDFVATNHSRTYRHGKRYCNISLKVLFKTNAPWTFIMDTPNDAFKLKHGMSFQLYTCLLWVSLLTFRLAIIQIEKNVSIHKIECVHSFKRSVEKQIDKYPKPPRSTWIPGWPPQKWSSKKSRFCIGSLQGISPRLS